MHGRGDEFLAGPRLAADQDGRVADRDLLDLQVHLPHGVRVADDVFGPELLLQGVAEAEVLRLQRLPAHRLALARTGVGGDHAGHDLQHADPLPQDLGRLGRQVRRERADQFALQANGHAQETDLIAVLRRSVVDPVLEPRFLGNARHDDGLGRLNHQADDAFPDPIPRVPHCRPGDAMCRLHQEFLAIGKQQHHRSPQHSEPPFKRGQDGGQQLLRPGPPGDEIGDLGKDIQVRLVLLQMGDGLGVKFDFDCHTYLPCQVPSLGRTSDGRFVID